MDTLEALFPSAACYCGRAAKSLRSGWSLRAVLACRVAKDQNRTCRWPERRMDRRFEAFYGRKTALGAGFTKVTYEY